MATRLVCGSLADKRPPMMERKRCPFAAADELRRPIESYRSLARTGNGFADGTARAGCQAFNHPRIILAPSGGQVILAGLFAESGALATCHFKHTHRTVWESREVISTLYCPLVSLFLLSTMAPSTDSRPPHGAVSSAATHGILARFQEPGMLSGNPDRLLNRVRWNGNGVLRF